MPTPTLILASTSPIRAQLLRNARVPFKQQAPLANEDALQKQWQGSCEELSCALATAKALSLSTLEAWHNDWILGCDQVLIYDNTIMYKAPDKASAREKLTLLKGKEHILSGAIALAHKGQVVWSHQSEARMVMRPFSDAFLEHYLQTTPESILSSVGAYQYEGMGIQLFEGTEGDYFSILGLPLLPLLRALRRVGVLEA